MGNGIPFLSCRGDPPKNDNTKVTLGLARTKEQSLRRENCEFGSVCPFALSLLIPLEAPSPFCQRTASNEGNGGWGGVFHGQTQGKEKRIPVPVPPFLKGNVMGKKMAGANEFACFD